MYLPRGRRASDLEFLTRELRSLYRRLEAITQRSPSHDDLMASIRREENADRLLTLLYQQRKQLALTDLQFYRLIRSREYVPAESFARLALTALSRASPADESAGYAATPDEPGWESPSPQHATGGGEPRRGIPILLSGIVPEPMSLFESIAEMGGAVVADDFACCGRRLYPPGDKRRPFPASGRKHPRRAARFDTRPLDPGAARPPHPAGEDIGRPRHRILRCQILRARAVRSAHPPQGIAGERHPVGDALKWTLAIRSRTRRLRGWKLFWR